MSQDIRHSACRLPPRVNHHLDLKRKPTKAGRVSTLQDGRGDPNGRGGPSGSSDLAQISPQTTPTHEGEY